MNPDLSLIPQPVLADLAVRGFEAAWPAMQVRLRQEMKRERYVTFALAAVVVAAVVGAQRLLK